MELAEHRDKLCLSGKLLVTPSRTRLHMKMLQVKAEELVTEAIQKGLKLGAGNLTSVLRVFRAFLSIKPVYNSICSSGIAITKLKQEPLDWQSCSVLLKTFS